MFASFFLVLFLLDLFHFSASAHLLLLILNSMSSFLPPLLSLIQLLNLPNCMSFSFPFAFAFPSTPFLLVSFVLHCLFSLLISFLGITLAFPFYLYVFLSHFHSTPTSNDLLSLSLVMPVLVISVDIFVLIFKFAASEGKKDVMLALPAFAHSWAPGLLLFILSWSSTFIFKAECESFE